MPREKILFTKEGLEEIQKKWQKLTDNRPLVVKRLQAAREMGDLSENAAYHGAKFELGNLDRELAKLNYLREVGQVAQSLPKNTAGFGHQVTLSASGKEIAFTLVSSYEANPLKHKISLDSPLGKAILGKKVGDKIILDTPAGQTIYFLKKIC